MSFIYSGATKKFKCNLLCQRCEGQTVAGERCKKRTCRYLPTCHIHTKKKYGLLVKKSSIPNAGDGLFALKEFKQGEFIADYKGEVLTKAQRDNRYGSRTARPSSPLHIRPNLSKQIYRQWLSTIVPGSLREQQLRQTTTTPRFLYTRVR